MAVLSNTTGAADVIRGGDPLGGKMYYINVEIQYTSGAREFTETDLDNRDSMAVIESTAETVLLGKGAEDERCFGPIEAISEDGVIASVLGAGVTERIAYGTTAPAVEDRVLSKGNGKAKQAGSFSGAAGNQLVGDGYVLELDTTDTEITLRWPA